MKKPMKTQLEMIYQTRIHHQTNLKKLKIKYLTTVYDGVVHDMPLDKIRKKLFKETINSKETDEKMYHAVNNFAKKVVNVKKTKQDQGLSVVILGLLRSINKIDAELDHFIVDNVRHESEISKKQALKDTLRKNRTDFDNDIDAKLYFLASEHNDSAEDHAPYQGKMYIDEKWKYYIKDKELRKQINIYNQKHNVKTIQWVTGKPVWFVTRPYCRHYFQPLTIGEVLNVDKSLLIKNYSMHTEIGNREYLQTLPHRQQEITYIIKRYEDRLELHKSLYAVEKSQILQNAINKDIFLIRKWKKALNND